MFEFLYVREIDEFLYIVKVDRARVMSFMIGISEDFSPREESVSERSRQHYIIANSVSDLLQLHEDEPYSFLSVF